MGGTRGQQGIDGAAFAQGFEGKAVEPKGGLAATATPQATQATARLALHKDSTLNANQQLLQDRIQER